MPQTVVELFEEQVHHSSVRPALRRYRDGMWEEYSWKEWWDASERLAAGLMGQGVKLGERVCLLAATRMEWVVADMAIAMAGAVCVPVHGAISAADLAGVLEENKVRVVVVEDPVQLGKLLEARRIAGSVECAVYMDADVLVETAGRAGDFVRLQGVSLPEDLEVLSFDEVLARGRGTLAEESRFVARRRRSIGGQSVASILYTAGVSGRPRGVVLTHANLAAQVEAMAALQLFNSEDSQLLFLPLAHIFSRVLYLAGVGYGMTTVFGRGPDRLVEDLTEVRPTLLASVPRVFERLQAEILSRVERRGVRAKLLPVALEVGRAVSRRTQGGDKIGLFLGWEHRMFSRLLLEDVRELLGGRMRFLISGGAPLEKSTAEFFFSTGVLLLEGYGLTETSGAVCFNMPDDFRLGSVGKPLPGVDVTIAEDGEVLVRGATVMQGYLQEAVQEEINADGWFHTGDVGYFDREGFLFLTDRKRELIVTSTGKHVVPTAIEQALCEHRLIAHAILLGEGQPWLGALLALDPDGLLAFVDEAGMEAELSLQELTTDRRLHQALQRHVDAVNKQRSSYEHVVRFHVLPEFLSVQNQTLAASGAMRRVEVLARYGEQVEALFGGEEGARGGVKIF